MNDNQQEYYSLSDILKATKAYIWHLLKKWPLLLLAIGLGVGAGWIIYNTQRPAYTAECTFILEEKQSGLGGLGGLASQFGIDVGGISGGGGMFSGDNILEIISSKAILEQVLLTKTDSLNGQKKLADLYLDFSGLKEKWKQNQKLASVNFDTTRKIADLNVMQDSVINIIYENIIKKHLAIERTSKKGTIIRVQLASTNPEFSKLLVKRLVIAAKDFYVSVKTSVTMANVARLQKKADSLLSLLSNKTYQVANVQLNDLNPGLRTLQVPTEIATRDKTILATLYTEVVKNLEVAKTTLMLQTPVLEILDVPSLSLYDNKKGKLFFLVIGGFVFVTLVAIILFFRFRYKKQ